ncbi:MAG TPA: alpha/beta fold hydrolase [Pseudobdellovibrionaceae bacterium]
MLHSLGNEKAPILVCVPGLLGGAEDFRGIIDPLLSEFHVLIFDPNASRRQFGLNGLTVEVMQEIQFDCTADEIAIELAKFTSEPILMCGISLGGKIVYDFAHKFPHLFKGAVITDVSPGSFGESRLFQFVEGLVSDLNLNQDWPGLKKELRERIPEPSLRSLIQSQLFYPTKQPPAAWKVGMKHFRALLQRQAMDEQFKALMKVDELLLKQGSEIRVLKAENLSAIDDISFGEMKKMKSIKIYPLMGASHFIHITHKQDIQNLLMQLKTSVSV